jgi:hypothetical protein
MAGPDERAMEPGVEAFGVAQAAEATRQASMSASWTASSAIRLAKDEPGGSPAQALTP